MRIGYCYKSITYTGVAVLCNFCGRFLQKKLHPTPQKPGARVYAITHI